MWTTPSPRDWRPPLVVVVGMGMEPGDLGAAAHRWIDSAQVLAGGQRHLDGFPRHGGERIPFRGPLESCLDQIFEISRHKRTVVLTSGDPFFFGVGRRLTSRLGKDNVLVLPNVTSLQVFFSRLKEPWENVKVWSLHGRGEAAEPHLWLAELSRRSVLAFFTDPRHSPDWIARRMLGLGCVGCSMAVGEDLGLPSEKVRWFSLEEAAETGFSTLNMVALFPAISEPEKLCGTVDGTGPNGENSRNACIAHDSESRPPALDLSTPVPLLGLPEAAFQHEAGLITKMEVRVVSLAHLQLLPGQVLWDVGAGSGSVSIEAARMVPSAKIFALERSPRRCADIRENIERFQCRGVHAVCGPAPLALENLPDPDRVFIGGSGGSLPDILNVVAERLLPGGRVVQTVVSLENLEAARSFWGRRGFPVDVSQIQVSRGVPVGKGVRLEALNPVFIVTVFRKGAGAMRDDT